jgi:thymidylate synthase
VEGMSLQVPDLTNSYKAVVKWVRKYGAESAPRGLKTIEILGATVVIANPYRAFPLGVGRGVSKQVAAVEALQLLGGFTDPVLTCKASTAFEKVKDGGAFHGAYGPRAAPQFPRVIDRLKSDRDSRRAVVTIWDPAQDLYREGLHDYPCTVSLEYMIRNDKLVAITHMRSNDVWLGLAYDAFVFTQVQLTLCHILDVEPGVYVHHASSLHLYETDTEKVDQLTEWASDEPLPVGIMATFWDGVQGSALALVYDTGHSKEVREYNPVYNTWLEPLRAS